VLAAVVAVTMMMATAVLVMFVVSVMSVILVIVPTGRMEVAIVPIATICVADGVLNIPFR
jgi:hypothetical protein